MASFRESRDSIVSDAEEWLTSMGCEVSNPALLNDVFNTNPVMRDVWKHIFKHVRPKEEVAEAKKLAAEYLKSKSKYSKLDFTQSELLLEKPEDVALFTLIEDKKKIITKQKAKERELDKEIEQLTKQVEEKRNHGANIQRKTKECENKLSTLKLKYSSLENVLQQITDANEQMSIPPNDGPDNATQCIKKLMQCSVSKVDVDPTLAKEVQLLSPSSTIEAAFNFFQQLCNAVNEIWYNRCQSKPKLDLSSAEELINEYCQELVQLDEEFSRLPSDENDEIASLRDQISKVLLSTNETDSEITTSLNQLKINQMLDASIETESLEGQVEYLTEYLDNYVNLHEDCDDSSEAENSEQDFSFAKKCMLKEIDEIGERLENLEDFMLILDKIRAIQDENVTNLQKQIAKLKKQQEEEDSNNLDFNNNKLYNLAIKIMQLPQEFFVTPKSNIDQNLELVRKVLHLVKTFRTLANIKSLNLVKLEPQENSVTEFIDVQNIQNSIQELKNKLNKLSNNSN